ncbi:hypothetical protein SAMN05216249_103134 [Acetitomaculum ruminis DSM 5522]|uniref:Uncharacterized protein n=1 Tax=Acetitomaculum ruminis DSM 5522 TaxID=1120918 RepID=A0A1I0W880_9FIRM|nr:hypothetical protein [Acetitomaculum ruminis]SFA84527.1 hypothetical protein SAMN05216249_103134 [Acetitomaculum ruminis DSM 5522]
MKISGFTNSLQNLFKSTDKQAKKTVSPNNLPSENDDFSKVSEGIRYTCKGILITKNDQQYNIRFKNTAYVYSAINKGYIDANGKQIQLSDEVKDKLQNAADYAKNQMEQETIGAALCHNIRALKKQAETLGSNGDYNHRMLDLATKIMDGDEVSSQEERLLSEYNQDLYNMAKQAMLFMPKDGNLIHSVEISFTDKGENVSFGEASITSHKASF